MKRFICLALLSTAVLAGAASVAPAYAQDSAKDVDAMLQKRFALVDMQELFRASKAGKSIQEQLAAQQKIYQKKVDQASTTLKQAEEQLNRQRTVLAPDAYAQKRQEFERQVATAQRDLQTQKRDLDYAFGKAMERLQSRVGTIIGGIAEREGLLMVFPRAQVVLAQKSLDITPRILEQLDKELQTVKVDLTAKAPATPQQ
jgi:Skp family chaperone for outer membrane proteins